MEGFHKRQLSIFEDIHIIPKQDPANLICRAAVGITIGSGLKGCSTRKNVLQPRLFPSSAVYAPNRPNCDFLETYKFENLIIDNLTNHFFNTNWNLFRASKFMRKRISYVNSPGNSISIPLKLLTLFK